MTDLRLRAEPRPVSVLASPVSLASNHYLRQVLRDVRGHRPVVLGLIGTALYLLLFLTISWRIGDEGSIVYGAQRVAEGEVPYRDFFEVMGPGSFYWLALWFKVMGTSWATSRLAILLTSLVSAWAIYHLAARHCSSRAALFPAALYTVATIPLWPGANHHFDSNLWALLAVVTVAARGELTVLRSATAGVLAGISSTIMPQKGILLMTALILGVAIEAHRAQHSRRALPCLGWMACAFSAVGACVLVLFWAQGALGDLWYANVIWPATRYHSVNVVPYGHGLLELMLPFWISVIGSVVPGTLAGAVAVAVAVPLVFVAALPMIALLLIVVRSVTPRRFTPGLGHLPWLYVLTGIALFASECHRPDMMHLIYGSPVLAVVVTLTFSSMSWPGIAIVRHALVSCLALLAVLLAFIASTAQTTVETRRGKVHVFQADEAVEFLQREVTPGEKAFVYPYYPMYYFLADVRNPTRYSILMYHINSEEQFTEVIDALQRQRVRYVLWDTFVAGENLTRWFPGYRDPPAGEQRLERYLASAYRLVDVKNGFRILERVDRATGAP